jgi:hypothetical protein
MPMHNKPKIWFQDDQRVWNIHRKFHGPVREIWFLFSPDLLPALEQIMKEVSMPTCFKLDVGGSKVYGHVGTHHEDKAVVRVIVPQEGTDILADKYDKALDTFQMRMREVGLKGQMRVLVEMSDAPGK